MESREDTSVKKPKKHKDRFDHKESKKRKRDTKEGTEHHNDDRQQNSSSTTQNVHPTPAVEEKKAKKQKQKHEPRDDLEQSATNEQPNGVAVAPTISPPGSPTKEKERKKKKKKREKERPEEADRLQIPNSQQTVDLSVPSTDSPVNSQANEKSKKKKHKSNLLHTATEQTTTVFQEADSSKDHTGSNATIDKALAVVSDTDPTDSPFFVQTTCFYLPLSPIAQDMPLEGLCAEHFSPLILTFAEPFNGVVLSYKNPRFQEPPPKHVIRQLHRAQQKAARSRKSTGKNIFAALPNHSVDHDEISQADIGSTDTQALAKAIDEYGVAFVWVAADFLILQPQLNTWIEGYVSVQSPSQLGLVCWNLVNASIGRKELPKHWRWVGDDRSPQVNGAKANTLAPKQGKGRTKAFEGHYVDANGQKIEGMLRFRVLQVDSLHAFGRDRNFMSIEGSLLSKEDGDQKVKQ